MFIEKRKLIEALKTIPDLHVERSSEYAVEHGGKYPTVTVDFGIYQVNGVSEDGAAYEVTPQFIVTAYVKPSPHNEAQQEADAEQVHNEIMSAITQAFIGYQITVYGIPTGTQPFGSSEAYAVSYQLDLGPVIANFVPTT